MDRKSFTSVIAIVVAVFLLSTAIRYGQPETAADVSFDDFPAHLGGWTGLRDSIPGYTLDMLNPIDIFSGTYTNHKGDQVHLLFDFFSQDGGPHSPRNCLPGSGWSILDAEPRTIQLGDRSITIHRLQVERAGAAYVMDFWYVTPFGETANDFVFKLHELATSLVFLPRKVAFIRVVAARNPASLAALDEFEQLFIPEVYLQLPFHR
ncbi:MAG: EpsI family protein [candidate division Zixibacteria bacterium]|nr:EpsI family protein [candidate division Zixibacteria bacterium]